MRSASSSANALDVGEMKRFRAEDEVATGAGSNGGGTLAAVAIVALLAAVTDDVFGDARDDKGLPSNERARDRNVELSMRLLMGLSGGVLSEAAVGSGVVADDP